MASADAMFTANAMPISEKRGSMMFSQCAGLASQPSRYLLRCHRACGDIIFAHDAVGAETGAVHAHTGRAAVVAAVVELAMLRHVARMLQGRRGQCRVDDERRRASEVLGAAAAAAGASGIDQAGDSRRLTAGAVPGFGTASGAASTIHTS